MDVRCPVLVQKYDKFMAGVDLVGQKKVTYEVDLRSKIKYYLRVFFDLLDIGVNNAYIWYLKLQAENSNIPVPTSLEFQQAEALSLIGSFSSRKRDLTGLTQTQRRTAALMHPAAPPHQIVKGDSRKRCLICRSQRLITARSIAVQVLQFPYALRRQEIVFWISMPQSNSDHYLSELAALKGP